MVVWQKNDWISVVFWAEIRLFPTSFYHICFVSQPFVILDTVIRTVFCHSHHCDICHLPEPEYLEFKPRELRVSMKAQAYALTRNKTTRQKVENFNNHFRIHRSQK